MSTLSIPTQRTFTGSPESLETPESTESTDVDRRFEVLARSAATGPRSGATPDFETVFDLDYGAELELELAQLEASQLEPAVVRELRPRTRVKEAKPRREAPKAVRLTRRGRILLVLAFLGVALALMVPLSGWATATLSGGTPEPVRVVEVHSGDTLYGIAGRLARPGHVRDMVLRIQELNSLPGSQLTVGQKLAVPRG